MRKFFLFLMVITLSLALQANDKLSAPTQSFLQEKAAGITQQDGKHSLAKTKTVNGVETMDCFIALNSMNTSDLEAMGVVVTGKYDGMVTALIPVNKVNEVAALGCVKQIGISRVAHHKTNVAKTITNADKVWDGTAYGLPQAYQGEDVVIGVIDGGIQFNHLAFKDEQGNSRVKVVYLPNASSGGSTASVNGVTFSGRQYTGSQIASLTTDDTQESHGTHTSSCAGGSPVNGYSGMAPKCDLVLCGLGTNMSETAIVNSAKYIANYAQSVGKPCVISISLGTNTGPHDGSNSICKAYDQIATQFGAVILLASGNEADATGYVTKTLASDEDAMVVLHESESGGSSLSSYAVADFWTSNTSAVKIKVMVVNKSTGAIVSESNEMTGGRVTSLEGFSSVNIQISNSTYNGRRNIYIVPKVSGAASSSNRIAYVITGAAGTKIDGWSDGGYSSKFASNGNVTGYTVTKGQADGTFCDDVTGFKTISVGAQCTRNTDNGGYNQYDVANWSSFGTDCNGNNHPFITAPGHYVISALNTYDSSRAYYYTTRYQTTVDGVTYYWGDMSGTSMATPVAAGVVALFLQANPTLDVDGVKEVIMSTATAYSNPRSPAKQRGYGIINALAGVEYIQGGVVETPVATEATQVGGHSFTANWNACEDATGYTLRVQQILPSPELAETFAKCSKAGSVNIVNSLDSYCDNPGWTGSSLYEAVGGIRMGTGNAIGTLTTPAINMSDSEGKVYVKFNAQAYNNDTDCNFTISCGDDIETVVIPNSTSAEYVVALDCPIAADQHIEFATTAGKKRVVITGIEVWNYEPVEASGSSEPMIFNGITGTSYTVSGLEPLTPYVYDVKAIYDESESGWSNAIKVTTIDATVVAGDVNGDGECTASDVTALYNAILYNDYSKIVNGDQNGDGEITASDVTAVYNIILGL